MVIKHIEALFLHSKYLENKGYSLWLSLQEKHRKAFLAQITAVIRKELLGQAFLKALSGSIIVDGEIDTESPLYKYVKTRLYGGDLRLMLTELQSVEEEAPEPKHYRISKESRIAEYQPNEARWTEIKRTRRLRKEAKLANHE